MNQPEFPFDSPVPSAGVDRWQQERQAAMHQLARQLGLPLGHVVEVWLRGGVRLRGKLRLREDGLFVPDSHEGRLQFVVGETPSPPGTWSPAFAWTTRRRNAQLPDKAAPPFRLCRPGRARTLRLRETDDTAACRASTAGRRN